MLAKKPHAHRNPTQNSKKGVEQESVIQLSSNDAKVFFGAIDNPPKPNAKLLAAMKRYKGSDLNAKNGSTECIS